MPRPAAAPPARLVTIRFSHYCEKARWALTHARVPFREESHTPLFSWAATFGAGGKRTVPVLVTPRDGVLSDSTDILRWADAQAAAAAPPAGGGAPPPLLPPGDAEVARLEELFDLRLGPAARRLAYADLVPDTALLRGLLAGAGTPLEARLVPLVFPLLRAGIVKGLKVDATGVARSEKALAEVLAEVERLLADGRPFLAGARFSGADLTFAALLSPLLWPDVLAQLGAGPPFSALPAPLRARIERLRATPAGRHGLRMYAEWRGGEPAAAPARAG
jgi:glutathione S-transferase